MMKTNIFATFLILISVAANAAKPTDSEFTTRAKSAFLIDYDSGTEIVAKNADVLMPPSSMIKLMTLAVLFDEIAAGRLTMDSKLPVSENADYQNPLWYPASKICLSTGQEITVRDAILPEMEAGRMKWSDYGDDDVHPTAAGHALLGEFIAEYFAEAKAKKADKSYEIPAETVYPALYTNGALHDAADLKYRDGSWNVGTNNQRFPAGFVYQKDTGNEGLSFTVTGKTLFLVYKVSNSTDYGMAGVYINGSLAGIVNGYGVNGWGGPVPKLIEHYDTETEMHVEIRMLDDHVDKSFEIFAVGVSD